MSCGWLSAGTRARGLIYRGSLSANYQVPETVGHARQRPTMPADSESIVAVTAPDATRDFTASVAISALVTPAVARDLLEFRLPRPRGGRDG